LVQCRKQFAVLLTAAAIAGCASRDADIAAAAADARALAAQSAPVVSAAFESDLKAMLAAERIADFTTRCLSYPQAPMLHWQPEVVRDLCRQAGTPYLSIEQVEAELSAGRVNELNATFDGYLAGDSATGRPLGELERAFWRPFGNSDAATGEVVRHWLRLSPASAHALTASGIHQLHQALALGKNGAGIDIGSVEQRRQADEYLRSARNDLATAIRLRRTLLPAYAASISVANLQGDRAAAQDYGDQALSIDPADYEIYLRLMRTAEPKNGGSQQQLDNLAARAMMHLEQNHALSRFPAHAKGYAGVASYAGRDYANAMKSFDDALAIGPDSEYLQSASEVAQYLGQYEKAVYYASQALRFAPRDSEGRINRAFALGVLRETQVSITELDDVLESNPHFWAALYGKGTTYRFAGDLNEAERWFKAALVENPYAEPALLDLSNMYVTQLRTPAAAAPYVGRLRERFPSNARSWLLTYEVIKDDDPNGARDALRKFAELADMNDAHQREELVEAKKILAEAPPAVH
jgi:tetratricopeptide (TPR) repeat protein